TSPRQVVCPTRATTLQSLSGALADVVCCGYRHDIVLSKDGDSTHAASLEGLEGIHAEVHQPIAPWRRASTIMEGKRAPDRLPPPGTEAEERSRCPKAVPTSCTIRATTIGLSGCHWTRRSGRGRLCP